MAEEQPLPAQIPPGAGADQAGPRLAGAVEVVGEIGQTLTTLSRHLAAGHDKPGLEAHLVKTLQALLRAQASLAPVVQLFNRILFSLRGAFTVDQAHRAIHDTTSQVLYEMNERQAGLRRKGAALIPGGGTTVMTYSKSSTVLGVLLLAQVSGRRPRVICAEARPGYEGRAMAAQLTAGKVPTTLIVDAAVFAFIEQVEMVLLGADSLTERGVLGRVGTRAIAAAAAIAGVPTYVVADSAKIWPAALGNPPVIDLPGRDVWEAGPPGLKMGNRQFDLSPWTAFAGVITDKGLLTPEEVAAASRSISVYPGLQAAVAEVRQESG